MLSKQLPIVKVIILQALWYFFVSYGSSGKLEIHAITISLIVLFLNLKFFRNSFSLFHNLIVVTFFIIWGIIETNVLKSFSLLSYDQFPYWLISLYVVFFCYYGDIFNYLSKQKTYILSLLGALGGVFAFYAGVNIANLEVKNPYYLISIGFSWALFFPVSIKMFYSKDLKDKILDLSVFFSFDKSGYVRHEKKFREELNIKQDSNILITGGSSGIGLAVAKKVVSSKANAMIIGRDESKGMAVANNSERIYFFKHDMQDWNHIDVLVKELPIIDSLVLNAGGMPENFEKNEFGVESQMASQLFGHYYLVKKLLKEKKLKENAKIVWVSSGGMYLKKLSLDNIFKNSNYDKVATYAVVKRAQVELLESFSKEFKKYCVVGMHPGWVDTPGIQSAISGFAKRMHSRLRTAEQGADTICWLISQNVNIKSGKFYFDRNEARKNTFWFTKVDKQDVKKLYETLNEYYNKISHAI